MKAVKLLEWQIFYFNVYNRFSLAVFIKFYYKNQLIRLLFPAAELHCVGSYLSASARIPSRTFVRQFKISVILIGSLSRSLCLTFNPMASTADHSFHFKASKATKFLPCIQRARLDRLYVECHSAFYSASWKERTSRWETIQKTFAQEINNYN